MCYNNTMKKRKFEIIIVLSLLAVSLLAALIINLNSSSNTRADVYYNGEIIDTIDLSIDNIYSYEADYHVTLEVSSGAVRFVQSLCPDHLCEGFGYIRNPFENAVCMPAKVVVIVNENN